MKLRTATCSRIPGACSRISVIWCARSWISISDQINKKQKNVLQAVDVWPAGIGTRETDFMKKIILLYFICSFSIYAQGRNFLANEKTNGTSTIDSLFSSVNKQLSGYPSECIYLQTSKGIYEAGEDLWFKAYQLDVQTFGLSDKSKTLYLQMINPNDSVVWQEKYQDGIANGIKGGIIIGENIGKY